MNEFEFHFEGKVDHFDFGKIKYHVLYAPAKLRDRLNLQQHHRLRIDGVVAGIDFHGAFQPAGNKRYYLILSKRFLRSSGLAFGDRVAASFNIADQSAVDVPHEMQNAIDADPIAKKIWHDLTPGKKRGFAYRVKSAKRIETRENRIEEIIEMLCRMDRNATAK